MIGQRASLTDRARREICRRVGDELDSVAELAREFGVGWATAHQAVIDHGDQLITEDRRFEHVIGFGVDEHTFQHANASRRTQMVTTFVDIDRGRLLDTVPGRSGDVVRTWVRSQPCRWPDQIHVATIDAFAGYAAAIRDVLPDATLVADHFHAIRLASEAVNDVRRRVQQDTTGHRGRKGDPLYGIRRLLLMTWKNLNDRGWERLRAGLAAGDRDGEIAAVWLARELLSEVYAAPDLAAARRRLVERGPRLPLHQWRFERPNRSGELAHREDPSHRTRLPQLRQLPTPPTPWLRHSMDYHHVPQNPRPPTSVRRVEPVCRGEVFGQRIVNHR